MTEYLLHGLRYSTIETGLSAKHLWNSIRVQWFLVAPTKIVSLVKLERISDKSAFLEQIKATSFDHITKLGNVDWDSGFFCFVNHVSGYRAYANNEATRALAQFHPLGMPKICPF